MKSSKNSKLADLGTFGLINHIAQQFTNTHPSTVKGIGDDAAVVDTGENTTLIASGLLLERVHFDLSYVPLPHLGYKAITASVSDIVAMNGLPTQATVCLGLSSRFTLEAVEALYEGIRAACGDYKMDLVGAKATTSATGLTLSVSAFGQTKKTQIIQRGGAEVNDLICVTGDLGAAYLGLQVLQREKAVFQSNPAMQPDIEKYDYLVQRQLKPSARIDIIHEFARLGLMPTAMVNVSDGLASELLHLAQSSDVGIMVYEDKIPIAKMTLETAIEFNLDPITCALNGGEDYELLFTIQQSDFEKIEDIPDITTIGYVCQKENGAQLMTTSQQAVDLKAPGWK